MDKVTPRRCCVCGKPSGVLWHAWQLDGVMRSLPTHLHCLLALRAGTRTIKHPEHIPGRLVNGRRD